MTRLAIAFFFLCATSPAMVFTGNAVPHPDPQCTISDDDPPTNVRTQPNGLIITAASQEAAIRTKRDTVDGVVLAGQRRCELAVARDVPQPELRGDMAAVGARNAAGEHELRVHGLPRVHTRAHVGIRGRFGECSRIEWSQEDRTSKVVAEHRADLGRAFVAGKLRHRDGDRREIRAGMNVDVRTLDTGTVPPMQARIRSRALRPSCSTSSLTLS